MLLDLGETDVAWEYCCSFLDCGLLVYMYHVLLANTGVLHVCYIYL